MSLKIDVTDIVHDHLNTLVDGHSGKASWADWTIFGVLPIAVATVLVFERVELSPSAANITITALAIFAGLLFNLLLLAHSIIRRPDDGRIGAGAERRLLREIYINISFAILVALAALVLLVVQMLSARKTIEATVAFVIYALLANFLLTLLMVLKRIYIMLSKEFASSPPPHPPFTDPHASPSSSPTPSAPRYENASSDLPDPMPR